MHDQMEASLSSSTSDWQTRSSKSDVSDTPPTSIDSESYVEDCKNDFEALLPSPFYPPTLIQGDAEDPRVQPRSLPEHLSLPQVPRQAPLRSIDPQDVGTPDSWIPRDSRLVRLTGKHPFNCEAKLDDLFSQGFLTPTSLFYIRNHGAVPNIDQKKGDAWEVKIHGLCLNPVNLSMEDLRTKFRVVTNPVTFVCAGNRRKEQNVVQKSLGFNWGAAGLSTTLFTGVYLSDVIEYVRPRKGAKHVIFEGSDDLPNGHYGTSQRIGWARDPRKRMMLAWAMNGVALEPDHGYPLRLVVPGQIGGRSVKWLKRIEISDIESQHYLHFHDNKVLPTTLGPDEARKNKEVWYNPKYIINDLNANSAIACPNHNEELDLATHSESDSYLVQGYAYAGGGRRVARVELSFDDGETWNLCNIAYPEDLFRAVALTDPVYGSLDLTDSDECFCWCFWNFNAPLDMFKGSDALMVRCMDESLALQPRDMYWNPTGMMNNWWFRIVIHKEADDKFRFEHPTMAGNQPGGWMQRLKDEGLDPLKANFSSDPLSSAIKATDMKKPVVQVSMVKAGVSRLITPEELAAHNKEDKPWFVVQNEVYDGTGFLKDHPGGSQSITLVAGEDATEDFIAIHSADAKVRLAEFHIGTLSGSASTLAKDDPTDDAGPFLSQKKWKQVKLVQIDKLSPDTKLFKFALQRPDQGLGLPIGQHVYIRLRRKSKEGSSVEGQLVQRAYTPVSKQGDCGFIEMLIKIYYPNASYPDGGLMTVGFAELEIGDCVELKGPIGHFVWKGRGIAEIHGKERRVREVGMVCGGSGITPILQVLRGILHDEEHQETKVHVLDVNRHFDDILCRTELHDLLEEHNARYRLHHTLTGDPPPEDWTYSTGRINTEMLKVHLPEAADDSLVCICGPSAMEQTTIAMLKTMGWDPDTQIIIF